MYSCYAVFMLVELKVENFGIIENVRMRIGTGLTVITGETGSGKSLVLQALDAVMGSRVGSGIVRNGASRAIIEATFDISNLQGIRAILEQNEISVDDSYVTLRREIAVDGRGRASVNGVNCRLSLLRQLSGWLLEIHGQHEHQRLLDPESHLDSLDVFAGTMDLREAVSGLFYKFSNLRKRLRAVTLESGEKEQRLDFLRFALEEIESFEPRELEYEEMENLKAVIQNSGKLYRDFSYAYSTIKEEEGAILDRLNSVTNLLESHTAIHRGLDESLEDLQEAIYRVENFSDYLRDEKEKIQFSPERLEDVEERIAGYKKLFKKYGGTTPSIMQMRDDFLREISSIEMSDEEADLLRSEIGVLGGELRHQAEELSRQRRSVIPLLEKKLAQELGDLGMPGARIQVAVTREIGAEKIRQTLVSEDALDERSQSADRRERYVINEKGLDRVEFLLCANAGEKVQPLRKVASGGELSRIMLALKSIIMESKPAGTVIFDEVDTGVGGEIAHAIGGRLKNIALQSQVMVVTHLHQIAGLANNHFRIFKQLREGRTVTHLQRLQGDRRLKELARMLGGDAPGSVVMDHARELLTRNEDHREDVVA